MRVQGASIAVKMIVLAFSLLPQLDLLGSHMMLYESKQNGVKNK